MSWVNAVVHGILLGGLYALLAKVWSPDPKLLEVSGQMLLTWPVSVGGAIGALIALATVAPALIIGLVAAAVFVLILVVIGAWNRRSIKRSPPSLHPRFPSPIKSR